MKQPSRLQSLVARLLPLASPIVAPVARRVRVWLVAAGLTAELSPGELRLLVNILGEDCRDELLRTRARVDVGSWLCKGRVWVYLLDDELVLFAHGERPYLQRLAYDAAPESLYNHVTGCVVLSPPGDLRVDKLRMNPSDGRRILSRMGSAERI